MRTDRTYFLLYGLFNFSWAFIAPMYVLFLLDRGLDLFQASMVPAVAMRKVTRLATATQRRPKYIADSSDRGRHR